LTPTIVSSELTWMMTVSFTAGGRDSLILYVRA
jgi:hypothetical protein